MDQTILACDQNGQFLEYIPKEAGHKGEGKRHLAITVLLYNSKGQVLLQRRKHKIFDNIWDLTGATHPLHQESGTDESLDEATRRCLKEEWGTEIGKLNKIGEFNYFAKDGDFCENEHCYLMVGEYDGAVKLDPEVGYEYKWMDKQEFLTDMEENPENYSAWANAGLKVLKGSDFFNMERR